MRPPYNPRRPLPYRSGVNAYVPLDPELLLALQALRVMRLRLQLFMPARIYRQN